MGKLTDRLQTVDPDALAEAIARLENSDKEVAIAALRPRHARAILNALAEQSSIIERNERTARARRLSFEAAMGLNNPCRALEDSNA